MTLVQHHGIGRRYLSLSHHQHAVAFVFLMLATFCVLTVRRETASFVAFAGHYYPPPSGDVVVAGIGEAQRGQQEASTVTATAHSSITRRRTNNEVAEQKSRSQRNQQQQQKQRKQQPKLKFVFFVGLEGTGHHLLQGLIEKSPVMRDVVDKTDGVRDMLVQLSRALYPIKGGLFFQHCVDHPKPGKVENPRQKAVELLKDIASNVTSNLNLKLNDASDNNQQQLPAVTIPLNAAKYWTGQMGSYPQDNDGCRYLKYPNLDLLYDVCQDAGVQCEHAYVYRDPYEIVKSTTVRRQFNKLGVLEAVQLYTTMLDVIYAQMTRYPSRNAGCLGFFEPVVSKEDVWDPVRDMFYSLPLSRQSQQQQLQKKFDNVVKRVHKPKPQLTQEEKDELIPYHESYMNSMVYAHDNVLKLCFEQFRENGNRRNISNDDDEEEEAAATATAGA